MLHYGKGYGDVRFVVMVLLQESVGVSGIIGGFVQINCDNLLSTKYGFVFT